MKTCSLCLENGCQHTDWCTRRRLASFLRSLIYAQAAALVRRKGIVVQLGEAAGTLQFALGRVPHEAAFTTSIWGSLNDMAAVLEHAARGDLTWHVETMPLEQANDALDRVRRGDVLGRLVLTP